MSLLYFLIQGAVASALNANMEAKEAAIRAGRNQSSDAAQPDNNAIWKEKTEEMDRLICKAFGEDTLSHLKHSKGALDGKYSEIRVNALEYAVSISLDKEIQARFISDKEIDLSEKLKNILRQRNQYDKNVSYNCTLNMLYIRLWAFIPYHSNLPDSRPKDIADAMLDLVNEYHVEY